MAITGASDRRGQLGADTNSDSFEDSLASERALNLAIVAAEIAESFEEYLEILDRFYASDVTVSRGSQSLTGRDAVREAIYGFLVVLHVMAEVAGLKVSIHATEVHADSNERHSEWRLELVGVTGRKVILTWRTTRRWQGHRVVAERHYDIGQIGEALSISDLANPLELRWVHEPPA
jgi:hypothetical protein